MSVKQVSHPKPAWRDRGNITLSVMLNIGNDRSLWRVEQLWCKQLAPNRFELCCIPFFAYNLALGDEVEAEPDEQGYHTVLGVLKSSGHATFRAWFGGSNDSAARDAVQKELVQIGCLVEWYSTDLVAIDATSDSQAQAVLELLQAREQLGQLKFEQANSTNDDEVVVHLNPVWGDRANFIIGAWFPVEKDSTTRNWEQLWCKQLAPNRFELCCIPFFVRDLALGDEVETEPEEGRHYTIQRVVKPSGHWTFRVWFGNSSQPNALGEVLAEIHQLGCLMEFYSENLLGVSAPSISHAQALTELLSGKEQLGHLEYETGWT
jgi:hypothetical protein